MAMVWPASSPVMSSTFVSMIVCVPEEEALASAVSVPTTMRIRLGRSPQSLDPEPKPARSISMEGQRTNPSANVEMMAAPVGVTISPSTSTP